MTPVDPNLAWLQQQWGPLSRRSIKALAGAGVTPERLPTMTDWHLRRIRGIGPGVLADIRRVYPGPAGTRIGEA